VKISSLDNILPERTLASEPDVERTGLESLWRRMKNHSVSVKTARFIGVSTVGFGRIVLEEPAWLTPVVSDHLVPNPVLGIVQNFEKAYFGRGLE
jgi:hypothetical protein